MKSIRYRSEYGVYHGLLLKEGHKYIHVVLLCHPVKIKKLPKTELRYILDAPFKPERITKTLKQMVRAEYGTLRKAPKTLKGLFR